MQLVNRCSDNGIAATLKDLADFAPSKLADEETAIFIVSCFGRGEPTDSAKPFMAWLQDAALDAAPSPPLEKLRFAVFGLGSSKTHTEYYNVVGRMLDARLEQLGATRVMLRGEGDDAGM